MLADVGQHVQAIKAQTALPRCVGFGIRDGASAKAVGQYADGVIVGSELVKNFANVGNDAQQIAHAANLSWIKMDELRQAIDSLGAIVDGNLQESANAESLAFFFKIS